jgi:hypothetical protein
MGTVKEPLIKASDGASWSFWRLFNPIFPHLSSDRLRKIDLEIHPNCLRFRHAPFNQCFLKANQFGGCTRGGDYPSWLKNREIEREICVRNGH